MKNIIAITALAVVVVAGAVWKYSGEPASETSAPGVSLTGHSDHQTLIPADTLFYVGGLEPMDAKNMMASMTSMYQFSDPEMLDEINQQLSKELAGEDSSAGSKFALSLFNFFMSGLDDPQAMFDQTGAREVLFSSIYSVGLMPVLRYEADQLRFEQFLTQLENDANITALMKDVDGVSYRAYPLAVEDGKSLDLVAAYHEGDAVFTLAMGAADDQQPLRIALGLDKPANSLKSAGTLVQLKDEYGYLPVYLGYLSIKQMTTALTSSDNRAGAMLAALDEKAQGKLNEMRTPECAAEFANIAAVWPRWVMGYRSLDYSEKGFSGDFHMNIEIKDPALTEVLKLISGHLPTDMVGAQTDMFSMALGLDVSRLDQVIAGIAKLTEGFQYQCSLLQQLNGSVDAINGVRPMVAMSTGMARGLKGLRVSLFDVQGNFAAGDVSVVDGLLSVSGDQIRALMNILMAMNPDAGMINIPEDGTPVALPMPPQLLQGAAQQIQAMLAIKEDHAVVFAGDMATGLYETVLDEPLNNNGLLFFSMDYGKYMKLLGGFMDAAVEEAETTPEEKADIEKFRNAMAELDYREEVLMRFTDKGFEIEGSIDIKN